MSETVVLGTTPCATSWTFECNLGVWHRCTIIGVHGDHRCVCGSQSPRLLPGEGVRDMIASGGITLRPAAPTVETVDLIEAELARHTLGPGGTCACGAAVADDDLAVPEWDRHLASAVAAKLKRTVYFGPEQEVGDG